MIVRKCNCCGKEFDMWDEQEDFSMKRHVGYGSKFDGCVIDIDLCCNCFDGVLEDLIPKCEINPIVSRYDL